MIETEAKRPRVLLAAVDTGAYDAEQSLDELEELADTAGADTAARIVQKRPAFDSATCIGPGRLEEMAIVRSAMRLAKSSQRSARRRQRPWTERSSAGNMALKMR